MAVAQTEILDKISSMTVLELSELIKAMEDKFGVSAAATTRRRRTSGRQGAGSDEHRRIAAEQIPPGHDVSSNPRLIAGETVGGRRASDTLIELIERASTERDSGQQSGSGLIETRASGLILPR